MVVDSDYENLIRRLTDAISWQRPADAEVAAADLSGWPQSDGLLPLLASNEQAVALTKPSGEEQDHYVRRRVFQRLFVRQLLKPKLAPGEVPLHYSQDRRACSPASPDLCLSFSTAGGMALAAASTTHVIGVDIERFRPVPDAMALARRFFGKQEVQNLLDLPPNMQADILIRLWSAKEACLKAFGTGIVHGLDKFQFGLHDNELILESLPEGEDLAGWSVVQLPAPGDHIAMLAKHQKV
jgi:phosphopantetheinyl transferase